MNEGFARVILLAGPSGSGKSYIAGRIGLPLLRLDDFYKDAADPTMPRIKGAIDWESPDSWDAGAAVATIDRLAHRGKADVPIYSITANRQVGHRLVDLAGAPCFLAEGIFAAEIVAALQRRDLLAAAYALRRPRLVTFVRRLVRDLHEHRKPPAVLVRRGLALYRSEPRVLARQLELGCQAASPRAISRAISRTLA